MGPIFVSVCGTVWRNFVELIMLGTLQPVIQKVGATDTTESVEANRLNVPSPYLLNTHEHLPVWLRFQVLTAASMKMTVFWDVAPCSLVEVYGRIRGACWLHTII
jgi:hypothetical protein